MGFKSFDFFKKVQSDIETSTICGGIYSIIAIIIGGVLLFNEYTAYKTLITKKNFIVDYDSKPTFKVNFDFTFYNSPCDLLGVHLQDESGTRQFDIKDSVSKFRLLKNNSEQLDFEQPADTYKGTQKEITDVIDRILNNEGCQLKGNFNAQKIPSNFHFSFHHRQDLYQSIQRVNQVAYEQLNVDFKINELSFGEPWGFMMSDRAFKYMHPETYANFDGSEFKLNQRIDYDFFLKLLPVEIVSNNQRVNIQKYTYSLQNSTSVKKANELPGAYFRYSLYPVNVQYVVEKPQFYHFIVQVLAIVGGIFSVIGIINSLTQGVITMMKKK